MYIIHVLYFKQILMHCISSCSHGFTMRRMLARSWLSKFCPSLCPSVYRTRALLQNRRLYLVTYGSTVYSTFSDTNSGWRAFHLKFALRHLPLQKTPTSTQISASSTSVVRASKKFIAHRKSTTDFLTSS